MASSSSSSVAMNGAAPALALLPPAAAPKAHAKAKAKAKAKARARRATPANPRLTRLRNPPQQHVQTLGAFRFYLVGRHWTANCLAPRANIAKFDRDYKAVADHFQDLLDLQKRRKSASIYTQVLSWPRLLGSIH